VGFSHWDAEGGGEFRRRAMGPLGIFLVGVPAGGVLGDILADAAKREFVADDVFVIVALPDGGAWGAPQFIDPACGEGFELADDFRQAVRRSCRGRFGTCPYGTRPHRTRPYHNRNGTGTRCRTRTRDGTGTCGGTGTDCCRGGFRTRPYRSRPYRSRPHRTRPYRTRPAEPGPRWNRNPRRNRDPSLYGRV
jgi:hypothetical protein